MKRTRPLVGILMQRSARAGKGAKSIAPERYPWPSEAMRGAINRVTSSRRTQTTQENTFFVIHIAKPQFDGFIAARWNHPAAEVGLDG